jgi:hypothetical protein
MKSGRTTGPSGNHCQPDPPAAIHFSPTIRDYPRVVRPAPKIGAVKFQDASPIGTTAADSATGSLPYVSTLRRPRRLHHLFQQPLRRDDSYATNYTRRFYKVVSP